MFDISLFAATHVHQIAAKTWWMNLATCSNHGAIRMFQVLSYSKRAATSSAKSKDSQVACTRLDAFRSYFRTGEPYRYSFRALAHRATNSKDASPCRPIHYPRNLRVTPSRAET